MKVLVIGGTRYFGKTLVSTLLAKRIAVTILTRGNTPDPFGNRVERVICDRSDVTKLRKVVSGKKWDVIFDQVCMNAQDARVACEVLLDKVDHYLMTSTQSVYGLGQDLQEEHFIGREHRSNITLPKLGSYADKKRDAECVFSKHTHPSISYMRIPIVLGIDDYTRRLHWHVERVIRGEEIFFPNLVARISLVDSVDAANGLLWMAESRIIGPLNIAAKTPLCLGDMIAMIESTVGKNALLSKHSTEHNASPFGVAEDWFMDVSKAEGLGYRAKEITEWFPDLIHRIAEKV